MSEAFDDAFDDSYDVGDDPAPQVAPPSRVDQFKISHASELHLMYAQPGTVSHRICGKRVEHHGKHPGWIASPPPNVEDVHLNGEA